MDFFRILQGGTGVGMSNFDRLWSQKFNDNWPIITISGSLPLTFLSKGNALTNYRVYGTSSGVGDETENVWDAQSTSLTYRQVASGGSMRWAFTITEPGIYTVKCFDDRSGYVYCRRYDVTTDNYGTLYRLSVPEEGPESPQTATLEVDSDVILMIYQRDTGTADETITQFNLAKLCAASGSTTPASYIPPGYQIPLSVTSGITKNIYDKDAKDPDNGYISDRRIAATTGLTYQASGHFITEYITVKPNTIYTLDGMVNSISLSLKAPGICFYDANKAFISGIAFSRSSEKWVASDKKATSPENAAYARFNIDNDSADTAMLIIGSTAPDHYIPHRYTTDYNLYIGDSKLGEDEFLDYQEQKVYKDVSGTLTPTDPPVPFEAIQTFSGENTLSSTETIEQAEITGKIKAKENENESP